MDDLDRKIVEIDVLEKEKNELRGKKKELERKITDGENVIYKIIKDAIDKIVKGENIVLDEFKEKSLKKISEIIKNKKALIKEQENIDTKEKEICDKKKEYILLYIKSMGIKENKVIDYYEYEAQAQTYSKPIVYIVYIKDGDKILKIDNATSLLKMISGKTITIQQQDISTIIIDLDRHKLYETYERIKTNKNEIIKDIKINII